MKLKDFPSMKAFKDKRIEHATRNTKEFERLLGIILMAMNSTLKNDQCLVDCMTYEDAPIMNSLVDFLEEKGYTAHIQEFNIEAAIGLYTTDLRFKIVVSWQ